MLGALVRYPTSGRAVTHKPRTEDTRVQRAKTTIRKEKEKKKRKVKDDDGPFKGMVTIQSLAEDAGQPLDRVLRQAGGG